MIRKVSGKGCVFVYMGKCLLHDLKITSNLAFSSFYSFSFDLMGVAMQSKTLTLALFVLSLLGTACTSKSKPAVNIPNQNTDASGDQSVRLTVRKPSILKEGISSALYTKSLMRAVPRFKKCYPTQSEISQLSIKMTLSPQGMVTALDYVEKEPSHLQVASCLMDVLKMVRFPTSKNNQESEITQSFRFLLKSSLSN